MLIHLLIGKRFNHSRRSWLVLWEAGVVIELPPWTILAYPSALLYHFNIDIDGKLLVLCYSYIYFTFF